MTRRRILLLALCVLVLTCACSVIDTGEGDGVTMEEHDGLFTVIMQPTEEVDDADLR